VFIVLNVHKELYRRMYSSKCSQTTMQLYLLFYHGRHCLPCIHGTTHAWPDV